MIAHVSEYLRPTQAIPPHKPQVRVLSKADLKFLSVFVNVDCLLSLHLSITHMITGWVPQAATLFTIQVFCYMTIIH